MTKVHNGFTLIELIAVMVVLAILATTALPKFLDLSDASETAVTRRVAGNIESASALNHSVDIAREAGLGTQTYVEIDNCNDAGSLLANGLPVASDGSALFTLEDTAITNKEIVDCTLTNANDNTDTADYSMIGACLNETLSAGVACS